MRNVDSIIKRLLDEARLRVDLETGEVFAPRSNTPCKPIGTLTRKGYLRACINVDGKQVHVMLHRVVWICAHGVPEPQLQIDHGPRGKSCNAPSNLGLFGLACGKDNHERHPENGSSCGKE